MFTKNLLVKVGAVMLGLSMFLSSAAVIQAKEPTHERADNDTDDITTANVVWLSSLSAPAKPAAGMASVFLTDYNGGGALNFTIGDQPNGQFYQVAAASNGLPGTGQIFLAPGTYAYTASSGTMKSVTASVTLQPGQVIGLSFSGTNPTTDRIKTWSGSSEGDKKHTGTDDKKHTGTETVTEVLRFQDLKVNWQDLTAMAQ